MLAVAAGYLRGEYRALGVDFERAQRAVRRGARGAAGRVEHRRLRLRGPHFTAARADRQPEAGARADLDRRQQRASPASGWPATATAGARSPRRRRWPRRPRRPSLETLDDLAAMIDDLRRLLDEAGRDPASIDIAFRTARRRRPGDDDFDADAHLDGARRAGRPRHDLEQRRRARRLARPRPRSARALRRRGHRPEPMSRTHRKEHP